MAKNHITDYTEREFLELIKEIYKENDEADSDDLLDKLINHFEKISEHPDGSDLIYYPEGNPDPQPEDIVNTIKDWRKSQGLPCFKDD